MKRAAQRAALAAALVAACALALVTRRMGEQHFLRTQRYEDVYYLPPPAWLLVFSLGHREALADLIWAKSLVYFGDEVSHHGDVEHIYQYTDAMLTLDPYFKKVYQWVSACALYRPGNVTARDARKVIAYLERAVRLFPDDGELSWTLGANYLYELPPLLTDPKEREEAKRQALEHLKVAALRGAGPPWLALSTATELGKLGQREQQIEHLQAVYDQVSDPESKQAIEDQIAVLRSAAFAEALHRTYEELEKNRARDFPYIDRELYLLVGKRPPFDGLGLMLQHFDPLLERVEQIDAEASAPRAAGSD
jgi:hypothetical protein